MYILHIFTVSHENFNRVQSITQLSPIFITLETGFYAGFSNRFHCMRLQTASTRMFWSILKLYYNMINIYIIYCQIKTLFQIESFTLINLTQRILSLQFGKHITQALQADKSLIQPHGSLILHILGVVINCGVDKRTLLSVAGKKTQTQCKKSPNLSACETHNPFTQAKII